MLPTHPEFGLFLTLVTINSVMTCTDSGQCGTGKMNFRETTVAQSLTMGLPPLPLSSGSGSSPGGGSGFSLWEDNTRCFGIHLKMFESYPLTTYSINSSFGFYTLTFKGRKCEWGGLSEAPALHARRPPPFSLPSPNALGRIVNGKESRQGAWPWQASLQVLHPKMGLIDNWCGGVLISTQWVITAAHCIYNDVFSLPIPALWTVVLGDHNRMINERSEQRIPVDRIFIHDHFHNYHNDIALLKLSRPARKTSMVRKICLPSVGYRDPGPGVVCVATGWGLAAADGRQSSTPNIAPTLLQASVPLHSNSLCRSSYGPAVSIRDGHLCAGNLDGSSGACVGDSGGPLQCSSSSGHWVLTGITSFGSGCARPGFPDVYTRMSHYVPWIRSLIHPHSDDDDDDDDDDAGLYDEEDDDEDDLDDDDEC